MHQNCMRCLAMHFPMCWKLGSQFSNISAAYYLIDSLQSNISICLCSNKICRIISKHAIDIASSRLDTLLRFLGETYNGLWWCAMLLEAPKSHQIALFHHIGLQGLPSPSRHNQPCLKPQKHSIPSQYLLHNPYHT